MAQRNDYTATNLQTVFTYTFQIFETSEIDVYQDGTLLTETTDYTVTNSTLPTIGGTITLVTGATTGDLIALVQSIPVARLIDYVTNGDMRATDLDDDFDRIYTFLNGGVPNDDLSDRLLRFADSEDRSSNTNLIPSPVNGQLLSWDADGELVNIDSPSVSIADTPVVANVAALKALDSATITAAYVLGTSAINDAGGGYFIYSSGNAEVDNGVSVVTPNAAGGRWLRQNNITHSNYIASAGGTANALTLTTAPLANVTLDPLRLFVVENTAGFNTSTTPTLTINSLTVKTIKRGTSTALNVGDLGPIGYKLIFSVLADASAVILLNPYKTTASWIHASLVGSSLSIATTGTPALASLNSTDVAFYDDNIEELRTYRFNGTAWAIVGSGLSIAGAGTPALTALNGTDVAFIDTTLESLRCYRFNGSTWALVGSGLSIAGISGVALAALNSTDVAFYDSSNTVEELRTYRFNGSTWALVGSGLSIAGTQFPALAALNSTDVAFYEDALTELRTYRFNGTTWSIVGSGLAIAGSAGRPALTALNRDDVVLFGNVIDELRVYRFNGTTWAQTGSGFPISTTGLPALAAINGTDVAYIDSVNEVLSTYRFAFYIGDGPHRPS